MVEWIESLRNVIAADIDLINERAREADAYSDKIIQNALHAAAHNIVAGSRGHKNVQHIIVDTSGSMPAPISQQTLSRVRNAISAFVSHQHQKEYSNFAIAKWVKEKRKAKRKAKIAAIMEAKQKYKGINKHSKRALMVLSKAN